MMILIWINITVILVTIGVWLKRWLIEKENFDLLIWPSLLFLSATFLIILSWSDRYSLKIIGVVACIVVGIFIASFNRIFMRWFDHNKWWDAVFSLLISIVTLFLCAVTVPS